MKKFILIIFTFATLFISCEYCCPYCNGYGCCYCCEDRGIAYNYDYFCADKLFGTWQCDHNSYVGTILLKEIKFLDNRKCDIIYSVDNGTDWYTETYSYAYKGNYISFSKVGMNFEYKVDGYIFPELYLRDSFNRYTWRKVRSYGC